MVLRWDSGTSLSVETESGPSIKTKTVDEVTFFRGTGEGTQKGRVLDYPGLTDRG